MQERRIRDDDGEIRGMADNETAFRVCKPQDETSSRVVSCTNRLSQIRSEPPCTGLKLGASVRTSA